MFTGMIDLKNSEIVLNLDEFLLVLNTYRKKNNLTTQAIMGMEQENKLVVTLSLLGAKTIKVIFDYNTITIESNASSIEEFTNDFNSFKEILK